MKTYQADEAIAKFRECFDDAELKYELTSSSTTSVRMTVTHEDVSLNTWFDVERQTWGFDLLQGGVKSCDTFEAFEDYFGTYLSIYSVFIPNAKIVTDAFEREFGINTVFDSFSGNKQKGYTIKFKVLGAGDQNVLVQRITEGYLVRLVVPDDATQKFKVRYEYKYELSDDGVATPIPTIHMFMKQMKDRYADDSDIQIQRVGDSLFSFSIEGLVISAEVTFNYMEVRYHVTEVSCYDADLMISPEDPFNLSAVYMACKDFYDDSVASEADDGVGSASGEEDDAFEAPPSDEQEPPAGEAADDGSSDGDENAYHGEIASEDVQQLHQEEQDAVDGKTYPFEDSDYGEGADSAFEAPEASEGGADAPQSEEVQPVSDQKSKRPPLSSLLDGATEQPEALIGGKTMSVESIKLVKEDEKVVGIQFIVDGDPYIFGVDRVKSAGLPVKRVKESVNIVYKCGMRMTEDEIRLKRYADELDNPDEVLKRIIDAVFS